MNIRTTTAMGNLFSCDNGLKKCRSRPYEFSQKEPNHDYSLYDPVADMRDDKDHKCDDKHSDYFAAGTKTEGKTGDCSQSTDA